MTQNQNNTPQNINQLSLAPDVRQALEHLKPQQRQAIIRTMQEVQILSGPFPPPDMLQAYDKVFPGCSDRIFKFTEDQLKHRIAMEAHVLPAREAAVARGQHYGLVLGLAAVLGAVICAYLKSPTIGSVLVGPPMVGLAYSLLIGKGKQEKEAAKK